MHRQQMATRIASPPIAVLSAAEVANLVDPLTDGATKLLLGTAEEIVAQVDPTAALERLNNRLDALTEAIEPVQELAARALEAISKSEAENPSSDEPDVQNRRVAVMVLVVAAASIMTVLGITDPSLSSTMALLLGWLAILYGASNDG